MPEILSNDWQLRPFASLCLRLVNGGTPDTNNSAYWDGEIPWITGADFTSRGIEEIRRYVTDLGIRSSATSLVRAGNLLVVTRTGVGKLAIAPFDLAISQDITGVYVNNDEADTRFIYYLLSRELAELRKLNQGTSINGIIRADLEKHKVRSPKSTVVQGKIAEILASLDVGIERTEALIEKYQQIKAGQMHDLFTRGVLPNGKLRPPREQAPELYQETKLGWFPKEWSPSSFRDLVGAANIVNGPFGSDLLTSELRNEGVPVLYVQDVKAGIFKRVSSAHITQEKANALAFCNVRQGDILVAKVGAPPCDSCVYESNEKAMVTQDVIRIRPPKEVDAIYLSSLLNSPFGRNAVKRISIEGTRERVSLTEFKNLIFPIAKSPEQQLIGDRIKAIQVFIEKEGEKCRKLRLKKNGLMHDLLTGKVKVTTSSADTTRKAA
ncbi:MAG: restriction modification system specificity domain [Paucimonas sp.]|nr:restriction modification system specificity domain [Paucimonas sp.]